MAARDCCSVIFVSLVSCTFINKMHFLDKGPQKSIRLSSINKCEILAPSKHRLKIPRDGVQLFEKKNGQLHLRDKLLDSGLWVVHSEKCCCSDGVCNVWFKNGSAVNQRNVSAVASRASGSCMLWKKPENEKFYHKTLQELYTKQMFAFELLWKTT